MYGEDKIKVEKKTIKPNYNPLTEHPKDIYIPPINKNSKLKDQIITVEEKINSINYSNLDRGEKVRTIRSLNKDIQNLKQSQKKEQKGEQKTY